MTQTAAPSEKNHTIPHSVSSDFFYSLMQAEEVPNTLLTSLVKGLAASCNWLCYARAHHLPASPQELQHDFPQQTATQGKG